jgi:hypothetical protein
LQQETGERPERNFSEFNPNAGIELAALTAILGSFVGAVSGRSALKSMKGITEGYRLGQQDLYERQQKSLSMSYKNIEINTKGQKKTTTFR